MTEACRNRILRSDAFRLANGRWGVAVLIDGRRFIAEDGIGYILKVEAEKECLNLGRRLMALGRG